MKKDTELYLIKRLKELEDELAWYKGHYQGSLKRDRDNDFDEHFYNALKNIPIQISSEEFKAFNIIMNKAKIMHYFDGIGTRAVLVGFNIQGEEYEILKGFFQHV